MRRLLRRVAVARAAKHRSPWDVDQADTDVLNLIGYGMQASRAPGRRAIFSWPPKPLTQSWWASITNRPKGI